MWRGWSPDPGNAAVPAAFFAQRYTRLVDWSSREKARAILERTNAFLRSAEAEDLGRRFTLPTPELL